MAYTPEFDLRDDFSRNYIINSDMRISQRGTNFAALANGTYTLDRWKYLKSGTAVHTITQDTDVPTFTQSGYQLQNSLRLVLTTPSASLSAGDYYCITQLVEGYSFASLAFKPMTLSFWVKATSPGVYYCALRNSGSDRSVVKKYTILASETWEKKVLSFPANPSAGTWNYTTGIGLEVDFTIACGATYSAATEDSWQTGNYFSGASRINGVNTGSTNFRVAGVMLNEGADALPFRLAGGNFPRELFLCQRYYEKSYDIGVSPGALISNSSYGFTNWGVSDTQTVKMLVPKRTGSPLITAYNYATGVTGTMRSEQGIDRTVQFSDIGMSSFRFWQSVAADSSYYYHLHWTADAEL